MRTNRLATLLLLFPIVASASPVSAVTSPYVNAYATPGVQKSVASAASAAEAKVAPAASGAVAKAKSTKEAPKWMGEYPAAARKDAATYEAQERNIAHKEAIKEREMEITHAAQIPQNERSKAILDHLHGLSKELNAAAKQKAKDTTANPAQP
jgi:hypothetical protein